MATRQSAFAKRRRLNNDTSPPTGSSAPASDNSRQVSAQPGKATKLTKHTLRKSTETESTAIDPLDAARSGSENTFSALVEEKVVAFGHAREFEAINDNDVRIRLTQGQTCTIYGLCQIWVRDGVGEVQGAILNESSRCYSVLSPQSDSSIILTAHTKVVEVQIESLDCNSGPVSVFNVPGLDSTLPKGTFTFRIVETEEDQIAEITKQQRTHFVRQLHNQQIELREPSLWNQVSRYAVTGNRSTETAEAALMVINRVLCPQNHTYGSIEVLLLDLDPLLPVFSWPGTIGIFKISNPVLGACHAYPPSRNENTPVQILDLRYVDTFETTINSSTLIDQVLNMLTLVKDMRALPIVIRTGSWLVNASPTRFARLCKVLQPDIVISTAASAALGPNKLDNAMLSATDKPIPVLYPPRLARHVSIPRNQSIVQSIFRFVAYSNGVPAWDPHRMSHHTSSKLRLSYGAVDSDLAYVVVGGGFLRPNDLLDTLRHNLVTIVLSHSPQDQQKRQTTLECRQFNSQIDEYSALDIAYVHFVDEAQHHIHLNSTIPLQSLQQAANPKQLLGLALQKPMGSSSFGRHLLC